MDDHISWIQQMRYSIMQFIYCIKQKEYGIVYKKSIDSFKSFIAMGTF